MWSIEWAKSRGIYLSFLRKSQRGNYCPSIHMLDTHSTHLLTPSWSHSHSPYPTYLPGGDGRHICRGDESGTRGDTNESPFAKVPDPPSRPVNTYSPLIKFLFFADDWPPLLYILFLYINTSDTCYQSSLTRHLFHLPILLIIYIMLYPSY